ncbi:putative phosphatase regulatory subunit [Paenibacillus curdlanolyticus YK9]|uniref:Putative phosphatase regulatory subunit n=1 Tax=Paenibacillus curdlanolyticus YK9 TaxID=717606 RepID=E0I5Q9_9BACL|nr:phosphatase [Paenibacillus curdlanolyticus]EFM12301.1 putative phosphatase regulatory subunit [Paenibacillus curdlanolyticus YK9]
MQAVKKIGTLFIAFALLLSFGFSASFSGVANAYDPNVQLSYAHTKTIQGTPNNLSRLSGSVDVTNLSPTKQVKVVYTTGNGIWQEQSASYTATLASGHEAWDFNIDAPLATTFEFAIKYVVNGQTYWDNNNGSNYKVGGASAPDRILSKAALKLYESSYFSNRSGLYVGGKIYLKNLAPTKTVTIVYSYDNWATTQSASATYDSFVANSGNAFETWNFSFSATGQPIKFAISYTVNGVTYWDNNNGANYALVF